MALSKDRILRILDRIGYTDKGPLGAACAELVDEIDNGASGVHQRVAKLVADQWAGTARAVASAATPSELKRAVASVKTVGELEQKLGLAPVTEPEPEPAPEPAPEPEPEAPEYTPTGTGW